jgi:hypothetical protein
MLNTIAFTPDHEYATGNFQAAQFVVHITFSSSNIELPLHKTKLKSHAIKNKEKWIKENTEEQVQKFSLRTNLFCSFLW